MVTDTEFNAERDKQLLADLITLRDMMADPEQVVKDRYSVFETAEGQMVPALSDGLAPPEATRGCLIGNMLRISGSDRARYYAMDAAAGYLNLFMAGEDKALIARINAAIEVRS